MGARHAAAATLRHRRRRARRGCLFIDAALPRHAAAPRYRASPPLLLSAATMAVAMAVAVALMTTVQELWRRHQGQCGWRRQ